MRTRECKVGLKVRVKKNKHIGVLDIGLANKIGIITEVEIRGNGFVSWPRIDVKFRFDPWENTGLYHSKGKNLVSLLPSDLELYSGCRMSSRSCVGCR